MTKRADLLEEIRELNIAYLMLAQQMLRQDRETAMFHLGIGAEVADLLADLSSTKLAKMAACQMVLPVFRFNDERLVKLMLGQGRDEVSVGLHAAIVGGGRPPVVLTKEE